MPNASGIDKFNYDPHTKDAKTREASTEDTEAASAT